MPSERDETGATGQAHVYVLGMRLDAVRAAKGARVLRLLFSVLSLYLCMGFLLGWVPADMGVYEAFGISYLLPFSLFFLFQCRYLLALLCAGVFLYFCAYRKKYWLIWLMPMLALALMVYYHSIFPFFSSLRLTSLP